MIPHPELLVVFVLTILGTVQAIPCSPTLFENGVNQGDGPLAKPLRFRRGIQATAARIAVIPPTVGANTARVEVTGVVPMPCAIPRQESNNMYDRQNGGDIEGDEVGVGAREGAQVKGEDEGKENGYPSGQYPSLIRRDPLTTPKKPPVDEPSVAKSCNSERLDNLPPKATVPWCSRRKSRMRARDIVFKETLKARQEVERGAGAGRALLTATVTLPPDTLDTPAFSKRKPLVGKEEDSELKRPPFRRQPDARDRYPNPDWFPLKPSESGRQQLPRSGPIEVPEDIQNMEESPPDPKRAPWLFGVGPAVSVPPPPVSPGKGVVNKNLPWSEPESKIRVPRYRDIVASERKTKISRSLGQKVSASPDSLSGQLRDAEQEKQGAISSAELQRRELPYISKTNQRSETDSNQLAKRGTVIYIGPYRKTAPNQGNSSSRSTRSMQEETVNTGKP
ncbi:hypothetical protein EMCG_09621 [[Emmonsia] crescens]|uniref:Uncharacterized protein n=1 Tax=[Emmonsia] crescens TaxID=73230 RepID=A0A0G2I232_9EURO|nr:hypothetical protein EMCG_09621 [Emmonsia crescens UAMH 3008]